MEYGLGTKAMKACLSIAEDDEPVYMMLDRADGSLLAVSNNIDAMQHHAEKTLGWPEDGPDIVVARLKLFAMPRTKEAAAALLAKEAAREAKKSLSPTALAELNDMLDRVLGQLRAADAPDQPAEKPAKPKASH